MDILIIIALILIINTFIVSALNNKYVIKVKSYFWILFAVHFLLTALYIILTLSSRSDSIGYYERSSKETDWFSLLAYGTTFIEFISWPLIKLFSLSYISMMILFSYLGYLSIVFFYLSLNENVDLKSIRNNFTLKELIFLLPNLHFWTSSLGKGAIISLGLSFFAFGLSRFNRMGRAILIILGSLLTLMVRPHIFLTLIVAILIVLLITRSEIKPYIKWLIISITLILFFYMSKQVVEFSNTESLDILSSNSLNHRAQELSKSNSGIDISEYNLVMKIFTFWFRPLFFDAKGVADLIISFENLLYIFFFITVIKSVIKNWFDWNGWFRILIFIFLLGSFILSQVTGNLGIAMRQKSQLMPFFFIVYCKALYYKQFQFRKKQKISAA